MSLGGKVTIDSPFHTSVPIKDIKMSSLALFPRQTSLLLTDILHQ